MASTAACANTGKLEEIEGNHNFLDPSHYFVNPQEGQKKEEAQFEDTPALWTVKHAESGRRLMTFLGVLEPSSISGSELAKGVQ